MIWHLADLFSTSLFQIKPCQILPKALQSSAFRAYEFSYDPCGAKDAGDTQQKTSGLSSG